MICVDTNLLIYAHRRGAPEHGAAQRAIETAAAQPGGWGFAWPSVAEFWAQVTHPRYPGGPSSPSRAAEFLRSLVETGRARIFIAGAGGFGRLLAEAERLGVGGPRIFDLQIALAALNGGATRLWTHDAGFLYVPGLQIEDPLAGGI